MGRDGFDAGGFSQGINPGPRDVDQTGNLNFGRVSPIRQLCCPMARSWWRGDPAVVLITLFNRSCTTLPPGRGLKPAISTSADLVIRQPCCPMARSWWRGDPGRGDPGAVLISVQSELYDPATGSWTQTGNVNITSCISTATLLPNGKVLVEGGFISIPTNCDKWGCTGFQQYYFVQEEL